MANPLTLIIGTSSEIFMANIPIEIRNERFGDCPFYVIEYANESITIISQNNYRICRGTNEKPNVLIGENYDLVNIHASRIANLLDDTHDNYIIGECVFVFGENTRFTKEGLEMMLRDYIFK